MARNENNEIEHIGFAMAQQKCYAYNNIHETKE